MFQTIRFRILPILATAAGSAALAVPSVAGAASSSGHGMGKVSVQDAMSTDSRSTHAGGGNFLLADGSVRFGVDAFGGFSGGVFVGAEDRSGVSGRITDIAVDTSDPAGHTEIVQTSFGDGSVRFVSGDTEMPLYYRR